MDLARGMAEGTWGPWISARSRSAGLSCGAGQGRGEAGVRVGHTGVGRGGAGCSGAPSTAGCTGILTIWDSHMFVQHMVLYESVAIVRYTVCASKRMALLYPPWVWLLDSPVVPGVSPS